MMQWFLNLKTGTKILGVFALELALFLAMAYVATSSLRAAQHSQRELYDVQFANARDVLSMTAIENHTRGNLFQLMIIDNAALQQNERKSIEENHRRVTEIADTLRLRNADNPSFLTVFEPWDSLRKEIVRIRENDILPLIFRGDVEGARQVALGEQMSKVGRLRDLAEGLIDTAESTAESALVDAENQSTRSMTLFLIATLLAIGVTLGTIVVMNRAVSAPLLRLAAIARRVSEQDLTVRLEKVRRTDEVGMLFDSFRQMIENLRSVTVDVNEGIGILAASSSEIMASSSQVAAGASETASAISETSSTVEEVKQTASMATQKAKAVSESSQRANDVARKGGEAVSETMEGMRSVRNQMDAIAESITRLSEQGQSIGAIIATVDDIAEQSNLLAVNAAIEAARAGDQGSGFAVVAQEMRSLAEQSKDATKQVRQILNDIQRGVSQAGMATEQGSRSVETGIKHSEDAKATIETLLDTVTESAQAAVQIAAASQQQLAGMDQIATAMENVRDASEQNVAATRQVEDSAKSLAELGQRLQDLIRQYKV